MATWLITGASRGFGREVALEALRRGDTVVATARNTGALSDIIDAGGNNVIPMKLNVADADEVRSVTTEAEKRTGGIDVLFNNAGIGYFAAFEEGEEAEERRLMEINVFGLAAITKALLPGMRNRRSGTIINVSSVGGLRSFPALSWYNASKFAVEGLSEAIAHEVAPLGIRMVLIEPGPFATDWAGNSAAETKPYREITDYASTAGANRQASRQGAGQEPGDPAKAAVAIVDVAHDANPPQRLPLGNIAYDGILEKFDMVRDDIAAREHVSRSADR
ncbi:oxidoreductase [Curtobacterium sp. L3-7]|uniref:oxidoreductase n=1 Tax=Curtobacterium sp. L3-7 TaxID=3138787 RepID=UPI003B51E7A7